MIESGKTKEARAAERRPITAASTMRADGGLPVDVVVLDISDSGVRIATKADLRIGQEISIGLAGAGVTRAFVAWRRGERYGCAFERRIAPEASALAFSNTPVVRLGHAYERAAPDGEDYLRDLYRRHRVWGVPLDAILMGAALLAVGWGLIHFFR